MENSNNSPDWLNKEFLQQALSSYKNNEPVEVVNFKLSQNFSQHYGSTMFQCEIDLKTSGKSESETLHVVIKAEPLNDELKMKMVGDILDSVFSNEIRMYCETLPAVYKLFEKHGREFVFAPE
jgi:hypothetical protein